MDQFAPKFHQIHPIFICYAKNWYKIHSVSRSRPDLDTCFSYISWTNGPICFKISPNLCNFYLLWPGISFAEVRDLQWLDRRHCRLVIIIHRPSFRDFPSTTPPKPCRDTQQNEKYILNRFLLVQGIGQYHSRTTKPKPTKRGWSLWFCLYPNVIKA